jgi:hypothetical protein
MMDKPLAKDIPPDYQGPKLLSINPAKVRFSENPGEMIVQHQGMNFIPELEAFNVAHLAQPKPNTKAPKNVNVKEQPKKKPGGMF